MEHTVPEPRHSGGGGGLRNEREERRTPETGRTGGEDGGVRGIATAEDEAVDSRRNGSRSRSARADWEKQEKFAG